MALEMCTEPCIYQFCVPCAKTLRHARLHGVARTLGASETRADGRQAQMHAGELSEQSLEEVKTQIDNLALSHFVVYKAFLPHIEDTADSSYTFFTGSLGQNPPSRVLQA